MRELLGGSHPLDATADDPCPSPLPPRAEPQLSVAHSPAHSPAHNPAHNPTYGSADALRQSLQPLRAGDMLLIEAPIEFIEAHRADTTRFALVAPVSDCERAMHMHMHMHMRMHTHMHTHTHIHMHMHMHMH